MGRRRGASLSPEDVVAAATRIVEAEGAEALGISRVARELEIKPASMYNHVASGEQLARLVAHEGNRRLLNALQAEATTHRDPAAELRRLSNMLRQWATENRGLYAQMAQVRPDHGNVEESTVVSAILSCFDRPLEALLVAEDERVHAMRALRSAIHGFLMLEQSGQFQLRENIDDSFRHMIDRLITGLRKTSGST